MVTVHLVRHGEVLNPNHVVYGDLPGFNLSPRGVLQAHACAEHLSGEPLDIVVTSPLARAVQTATAVARRHGLEPSVEPALTEAGIFPAWVGHRWEELDERFPGQLAGYLADASTVPDAVERLDSIAARVVGVIDTTVRSGFANVAIVAHQDPLQAARLSLLGQPLADLLVDAPPHASVSTFVSDGVSWRETSRWAPTST